MKKVFFLFFLIIPFTLSATEIPTNRELQFSKAADAYAANNFSQALNIYQNLLAGSDVSFELYYDMGNCYYRLGDMGHAVLYWEKAKGLRPGSEEVTHNLQLAALKMQDKVVLPKGFILFEWYWAFRERMSLPLFVFVSGLLFSLLAAAFLIPKSRFIDERLQGLLKRLLRIPKLLLAFLLILFISVSVDKLRYRSVNHFAIVTAPEIKVTGEPRDASSVLFLLHAGSKVRILSTLENWTELSYFDDKVGWVKSEMIEAIE